MSLETISIMNFRNLADVRIELDPKSNFFLGANGSGKTSLLDAFYFCPAPGPLQQIIGILL